MAKGNSTKSKVKSALWQGFGYAVGAAVFVPLLIMGMNKLGLKIG